MADRDLIFTLAKVIIAAAWADGEIKLEEINALKELLLHLPRTGYKSGPPITTREWATLEMYMQSPVGPEERAHLVEELKRAMRRPRDRELALSALENVVSADGAVTDEERAVLHSIRSALEETDLSLFAQVGRLIRGPLQKHSTAARGAPDREEFLDDFMKNRVFFAVRQRLNKADGELEIAEKDLRKLSLAGALMARVAQLDREVSEGEFDTIVRALCEGWDISQDEAAFVAEIAVSEVSKGLDHYRMTRSFYANTSRQEREDFLDVLFAVANADDGISSQENEEIRQIAYGLRLSRDEFIQAKLKALGKEY
jgi:uncharacterized tellurite resistance protein B-like protein